jgi:hypothetical protein
MGKNSSADAKTRAEKRGRQKKRRLKQQAEREIVTRKAATQPRALRTLTDDQAKALWQGKQTRVVIVEAYPGYKAPKPRDVDILEIAWQGGAPGLGKKR